MMTYTDIQNLLDRYWDGEATLEEERTLKAYFASGAVDPRLAPEAPYFQALREERAVQSPNVGIKAPVPQMYSTWQRWAAAAAIIGAVALGGWWMNQQNPDSTAVASMEQHPTEQPAVQPPASPVPQEASAIAEKSAVQEVKINHKPRPNRSKGPRQQPPPPIAEALDPETQKALDEVRAALALVSSKLNKGRRAATKNLNQVETLDKFFKHKKETDG